MTSALSLKNNFSNKSRKIVSMIKRRMADLSFSFDVAMRATN